MSRRPDNRDAVPARAPRAGLLLAASVTEATADGAAGRGPRWGAGLDWLAEMHGPDAGGYPFGAASIHCDPTPPYFGEDEKAYTVQADPFVVRAWDWCSAMDSRLTGGRDWQGRATRLLEATQSASIAAEFWYGAINAADAEMVGPYLDNGGGTAADGNTWVPERALALLDEYATIRMSNGRAMIHCAPSVLVMLATAGAIRREGGLWVTPNDNLVCADAGYGSGTRGIAQAPAMFATPVPEIILGPVRVTPLDESAVYTDVNDIAVVAERDVIVMWENDLLHGYIELNLAECPCDPVEAPQ